MQRPTWERVETLLKAALDIEDARARAAFLVQQCGSDRELLAELRWLLSESKGGNSRFLEPPSMLAFDLTGRTIDDFEIIEEIGRGSSGVVYRANQRSLNRVVALKVLPLVLRANDATAERFRREAVAASKLRHPGIASVISFGEVDGTFYYAMEFVDGPSLRDVMDRAWTEKALPIDPQISDPRAIARLVAEVADALHFAHEGKVVHRDVKPHNILLERNGRPRLIDFGLAKLLDQRSISLRGDLIGTMYYMSPEQTRARQEDVDRRSDVFSLGVVMYELLAHRRPFDGNSHLEIFKRIAEDDTPSMRRAPVRVPQQLEKICRHALEKEPKDRFQTAHEFAVELRRFLNGEPPLFKELPIGEKLRRTMVKRRTLLVAVPAAIAAGAAAVYATRPKGPMFRVTVETVDGTPARLVSRRHASPFGEYLTPLVDHGRDSRWSIDLPLGMHSLELVAADGTFAQWTVVPAKALHDNSFRVRLLEPVNYSAPAGWSFVPSGAVVFARLSSGFKIPGYDERPGAAHHAFLVDKRLVSNGDFRRMRSSGSTTELPTEWGKLAEAWRTEPPDVHDQRPLVGTGGYDAQRLVVEMGGRLPSAAEALAFATGGTRWWEEAASGAENLVIGRLRPDALGPGVFVRDYLAFVRGVEDGPLLGPYALHDPIGNVSVRTDTTAFDGAGVPDPDHSTSYGLSWWADPSALKDDASHWIGGGYSDRGNVDVGVRRVRPLTPVLGAAF